MQVIILSKGTYESRFEKIQSFIAKNRSIEAGGINITEDPDILVLNRNEAKHNSISIKQIRLLNEFIYRKPFRSMHKYLIIFASEMLTVEAQNALLKILEEPPEYLIVILETSNHDLLLDTICSRAVIYDLGLYELNEYIHEFSTAIIDLLGMQLGERLDWLASNKKILKENRIRTGEILSNWLVHIRNLINKKIDKTKFANDDSLPNFDDLTILNLLDLVNRVDLAIRRIRNDNANILLTLEDLLVNLKDD